MSPVKRPPWCGQCEERSRLVDLPNGMAARCPRCHPRCVAARDDGRRSRARRAVRRNQGLTQPDCPNCGARIYRNHRCHASAFIDREETR